MRKLLLVEDDHFQSEMARRLIEKHMAFSVLSAPNGHEALAILRKAAPEIAIVLMDVEMPVMDGLETLEVIREQYPDLPVIMLTSSDDVGIAVDSMKLGAVDFINKPPDIGRLKVAINNAIRLTQLEQEISRIRRKEDGQLRFADLVGFDGGLSPMVKIGLKAAQTDVPVLLGGETGVGKEVFARAIHGESKRAGRPFVAVNCGAIPKNLAESVLFGHEKGAFTGAVSKQIGKFREAEGGTIFLDEVGELPLDLQVKLLRALQQREIEPVGLGRAVAVNVRIISATNRDLAEEVRTGRFREDLFFRLDVLPIRLLPLRERRQDILPLAKYFLQHYAACDDLPLSQLSRAAEERLLAGYWPGNVRELENVIRRAMVMAEAEVIEADMLALSLPPAGEEAGSYEGQVFSVIPDNAIEWIQSNGAIRTMEQLEAEAIHRVLEHCKGNVTQAAKALGIAKSTFYKKLKRLEQEAV